MSRVPPRTEFMMRTRKRRTAGTRLHKVYFFLWDNMYDLLPQDGVDVAASKDPPSWRVASVFENVVLWVLCKIYGHEAVPDQCQMPQHDHCVWCNRSMPWMYERKL